MVIALFWEQTTLRVIGRKNEKTQNPTDYERDGSRREFPFGFAVVNLVNPSANYCRSKYYNEYR